MNRRMAMKNYIKPELTYEKILSNNSIANAGLSFWIETGELTEGITVHSYPLES